MSPRPLNTIGPISLRGISDAAEGGIINVKEPAYGAIGNNVADDSNAVDAAIAATSTARRSIYFPPGTYKITRPLATISGGSHLRIYGAGAGATQINLTGG